MIKLIENRGTSYDMRLVYHESTIEDTSSDILLVLEILQFLYEVSETYQV
jgi:hypothetical protein